MARLARAVFEGVPHHVTQRGNSRALGRTRLAESELKCTVTVIRHRNSINYINGAPTLKSGGKAMLYSDYLANPLSFMRGEYMGSTSDMGSFDGDSHGILSYHRQVFSKLGDI